MFVENLNDTMHPMIAHASSAGTAKKLWEGKPADTPKPMAIEQIAPFASDYKFFDDMGVRVYDHGHGFSGVNFSIHSSYSSLAGYEEAMQRAYGAERAKKILGTVRHNTVYYPSLTIKGAIQSIRIARPLAADKTVIESWTFRLKGAPDERARPHRDLQPPDQLADVGRRPRRPALLPVHPGRAGGGRQRMGQPAPQLRPGRGEGRRDHRQRHQRDLHAQPVPRLARVHGGLMNQLELIKFVLHEARLIDEKRFDEWYELFADDAVYWVPAAPGQTDPLQHNSLAYEDKLLLQLRIERLKRPNAFSQKPASRCHHLLQTPEVEKSDDAKGEYLTRTQMIYTETRGDESQRYAATAWHSLIRINEKLLIKMKRVDILNCDAALPSIQLFL